jgi:hypothetical protein
VTKSNFDRGFLSGLLGVPLSEVHPVEDNRNEDNIKQIPDHHYVYNASISADQMRKLVDYGVEKVYAHDPSLYPGDQRPCLAFAFTTNP